MTSPASYSKALASPRFLSNDAMKTRLHRFLVDALAFAYQVDHNELVKVVPARLLPHVNQAKTDTSPAPRSTILSTDEREDILCLANLVRDVGDKVSKHQVSLITIDERYIIKQRILLPARELNVMEGYVLQLLRLYSVHRGIDHRQAGLHTRGFFYGWSVVADESLEKRLVSDDLLIRTVSSNEKMRILLGSALAAFGDKHLRIKGYSEFASGSYWVDPDSSALQQALESRLTYVTYGASA
ncbi:hypothetical protein BDU57DRAFT_539027 [Ampelomyces quisqualis]|uniref:Uncharacterized protein n=1 Tax=Ampelomyces quisqualis TaxID=50730 RepID=A0A6A5QPN6_AMPQU|nr:hypothetical protein BDU57DRAFT_539027 [Ampelomyces quisqualis]